MRLLLSLLPLISGVWILPSAAAKAAPPNVLLILADDCTYNDLPAYGGKNARTPNIDRLATQGLLFEHAYLSEAMCQPCRSELYSGLNPVRNGCAWNHSASRANLTSMPQQLGAAGYRVGLSGKVHVKPRKVFPFESVPGFDPSCVRNPTKPHDLAAARKFITRDKQQPFCLVIALTEPHVPWVMGDASKYPPAEIELPPNLADTPRTREDFSSYLAEITYMDGQVGEILAMLDATGRADDTLVIFTSEQGSQFPGCKWTNWDTGLHTALIARWPGKTKPGTRTKALVQYCDVLPTLLEAAGKPPAQAEHDGSSFLPVLLAKSDTHRKFAHGIHNNVPEGPPYPIRTVTDGTHRYIRNLLPDEIQLQKWVMGKGAAGALNNPYWPTWVWSAHQSDASYQLVKRYVRRPAEELYQTKADPYELTNCIDVPEMAPIHAKLSAELDRWMAGQGDPGPPLDTKATLQAVRQGRFEFGKQ